MKGQQQAINKEFANIFTTLSARVEVFQTTQKGFLENYFNDLKQELPELNDKEIDTASAVYGICITDDALKNYTIKQYAEDINYLQSLIPEVIEDDKVEEGEKDEDSLPTHNLPKKDEPKTLADRVKSAIESETALMKVLTAYYQANSIIERAINNFNNDLIIHHVNERPEIVITSLLIRNHLLPLYENIVFIYKSAGIDVDLRFVTAQVKISIEKLLHPKKETPSMSIVFHEIEGIYPLGFGSDLYWDLSEQIIYVDYYPKLKAMLQPQIDEAMDVKIKSRETMMNKMEQVKSQERNAHSIENIRAKVDSIIFESFHFNRPFNDDARIKMQRAVEQVLKRMALEEYGIQDIPNIEKFLDYFNREFFHPIFSEYVQLYLPFIDIREYRAFVQDPLGTVEKQKAYITNQFWFQMRKYGGANKPNPSQLAHAFSMVMYDLMNNKKVLDFE
ncbi:MAG: hypothetical protein INQ03_01105 [Candidatus Heimdallarchaeota archaeon]|nr:hypothetical protein [Candidatus Heimdallarchaeota archaeon]